MAHFEDIDWSRELRIVPLQWDIDGRAEQIVVQSVSEVVLTGQDVRAFLEAASSPFWRSEWELNMQRLYDRETDAGRLPIISAFMPLARFRVHFCGLPDPVFERVRAQIRDWRDAGVEEVELAAIDRNGLRKRSVHSIA